MQLVLTLDGGKQQLSWLRPDRTFRFHQVPAGSHLVDVVAMGLVFPQVARPPQMNANGSNSFVMLDNADWLGRISCKHLGISRGAISGCQGFTSTLSDPAHEVKMAIALRKLVNEAPTLLPGQQ